MKGVEAFFDSNVLIYCLEPEASEKQSRASILIRDLMQSRGAAISAQVMQESVNVLFRIGASVQTIHEVCETLLRPMLVMNTTAELIESAVDVKVRWQYSFYDSLVIAAALACGAKTLYSEDLQHGQRIAALTIVNPFL